MIVWPLRAAGHLNTFSLNRQKCLEQCCTICTHVLQSIVAAFDNVTKYHAYGHFKPLVHSGEIENTRKNNTVSCEAHTWKLFYSTHTHTNTSLYNLRLFSWSNPRRRHRIASKKIQVFRTSIFKQNNMLILMFTRPFCRYLLDILVLEAIPLLYKWWTVLHCGMLPPSQTPPTKISPTSTGPSHQVAKRNSTNKTLSLSLPVSPSLTLCLSKP